MPSMFKRTGDAWVADAAAGSNARWGLTSWVEGATFSSVEWAVTPSGPTLASPQINADPVVIDGRTYAAGRMASVKVSGMTAGTTYTVTATATLSNGDVDARSFKLAVKAL